MYLSDKETFENFSDKSSLFWLEEELQYGDWNGGPNGDGSYEKSGLIDVPEVRKFMILLSVNEYFGFELFSVFTLLILSYF